MLNNGGKDMDVKTINMQLKQMLGANYSIEDTVGKGGFSKVYSVKHENFGTTSYVLKVVSLENEVTIMTDVNQPLIERKIATQRYQYLVNRTKGEIEILSSLKNDPYIVTLYDHCANLCKKTNMINGFFLLEERLDSLRDYIMKHGDLNQQKIEKLGKDISCALNSLERKNIIHRDVKPDNILVKKNGNFCLADFGMARALRKDISVDESTRISSGEFTAPEIRDGKAFSFTADIFSLGVTLYFLLSNGEEYLKPNGIPSEQFASPGLCRIISKCIRKNPNERFQHAGVLKEFLEDLCIEKAKQPVTKTQLQPTKIPLKNSSSLTDTKKTDTKPVTKAEKNNNTESIETFWFKGAICGLFGSLLGVFFHSGMLTIPFAITNDLMLNWILTICTLIISLIFGPITNGVVDVCMDGLLNKFFEKRRFFLNFLSFSLSFFLYGCIVTACF